MMWCGDRFIISLSYWLLLQHCCIIAAVKTEAVCLYLPHAAPHPIADAQLASAFALF